MFKITKNEIDSIFADTEFTVRYSEGKGQRAFSIYKGTNYICTLLGNISNDMVSYKWPEEQVSLRRELMLLPKDRRDKALKAFDLRPADKGEEEYYSAKQSIMQQLDNKPKLFDFRTQSGDKVYFVGMREELILDSTDKPELIGTFGLGPCIGVALVSKKGDKVYRVGLTHIDALTDLKSVWPFVYNTVKDSDSFDVVMISSENDRVRAKQILEEIFSNPRLRNKATVMSELNGPTNFAVDTLTGRLYTNIPSSAFVGEVPPAMEFIVSSELLPSRFYNPEQRKTAKHFKVPEKPEPLRIEPIDDRAIQEYWRKKALEK